MASVRIKTFRTTPRRLGCAEVFFKCLEVFAGDGYGTMRDSIRGVVYNPLAGNTGQFYDPETGDGVAGTPLTNSYWMQNGDTASNSVRPTNGKTVQLESGTWPVLGRKKVIIFGCGVLRLPSLSRIPFGNGSPVVPGSDGNVSVSLAGALHGVVRGINGGLLSLDEPYAPVCNTSLTGKLVAIVGEYTPATELGDGVFHFKVIDADGNVMLGDDGVSPLEVTRAAVLVEDCTPHLNNKTRFGGLDFFGIRLFSFTGALPATREAAYKWMIRHYAAGHREEPPQFVGYS